MAEILRALFLFILAGLAEIGGSGLVCQWLREGRGFTLGRVGSAAIALAGVAIIANLPSVSAHPRQY